MNKLVYLIVASIAISSVTAQQNAGWQQHAAYKMDVVMDVANYKYKGTQELVYTNNSPDTLRRVFYHLYPNAFQPGSEMDMRIRSIKDPDGRMVTKTKVDGKDVSESRIKNLKPNEIGYLNISDFKQDGITAVTKVSETVFEVTLPKPILPGGKTTFSLKFDAQVPVQIRRSGRNNKEGVALSMAQWYPKLAEYDFEGWHADPYIAREFHGVWADFDVKITIDKDYIIGGTGYLQNKNDIGYNYQDAGVVVNHSKKMKTLTWHFIAPKVHDFTWAADKDYIHDLVIGPDNVELHFLYKNNPKILDNWKNLQPLTVNLLSIYNQLVGKYPYKQYSVIQGGDGGMEYAMCTLILGEGTFPGLVGVTAHELAHAWFQHILATNESKHGWMDEGFASYIEEIALNELAVEKVENPFLNSYKGYYNLVASGKEQPLSTHADRFDENRSYSIASYSKGLIFLSQLEYLIGRENVWKALQKYYTDFKFKHPTPNDFKRSAEKVSGAQLDWYLTDWTQTVNTIDYRIVGLREDGKQSVIDLKRIGRTPMPIDLQVEYTDGSVEQIYIPLQIMAFEKPNTNPSQKRTVLKPWVWGNPDYQIPLSKSKSMVKRITIDPSGLMADVNHEDNILTF